jgi:hypothetical protein
MAQITINDIPTNDLSNQKEGDSPNLSDTKMTTIKGGLPNKGWSAGSPNTSRIYVGWFG